MRRARIDALYRRHIGTRERLIFMMRDPDGHTAIVDGCRVPVEEMPQPDRVFSLPIGDDRRRGPDDAA